MFCSENYWFTLVLLRNPSLPSLKIKLIHYCIFWLILPIHRLIVFMQIVCARFIYLLYLYILFCFHEEWWSECHLMMFDSEKGLRVFYIIESIQIYIYLSWDFRWTVMLLICILFKLRNLRKLQNCHYYRAAEHSDILEHATKFSIDMFMQIRS